MTLPEEVHDLMNSITPEKKNAGTVLKKAIAVTGSVVVFTVICLLFRLSLRPHQVFSFLYLALAVLLARETLLDVRNLNPGIRPAPLIYLPAIIWFFSFAYFDIFYIGFGPRVSFKSVIISLLLLLLLIFVYALLTACILDHIFAYYADRPDRALFAGVIAAVVTIIIVWYFSLQIFHAAERSIGLTGELCAQKFGITSLFWDFLGYI